MPSKVILEPRKIIDSKDMSGAITSDETGLADFDELLMEVEWTGTSPVGEITVLVRSLLASGSYTQWYALSFSSQILISGNSGKHVINFESIPFGNLMVAYVPASGLGTLNVWVSGKTLGGTK